MGRLGEVYQRRGQVPALAFSSPRQHRGACERCICGEKGSGPCPGFRLAPAAP